jgi:hypothetical protein
VNKDYSYMMYPPSVPIEPPSGVLLPQISVDTSASCAATPSTSRTGSLLANSAIPLLMLAPYASDAEALERTKMHLNLITHQDMDRAGPMRPAEKRRRFFMRSKTNSAPDSSFDGVPKSGHHSVSFCLGVKIKSKCNHHHPTDPTVCKYNLIIFLVIIFCIFLLS